MPSSGYRKQTMDFGDMSRDLQNAAASFAKMSAAAGTFVSLVGAFKSFELEVVRANSAIGGTAKTFKQLSDAARNFALVSKYSAGEAASSMVMLAQAGFDTREVLAAMPSVLQLAQASMENLDLVADTVASTIRTFNLNASEASRVTNVFAASCVNSLATVNKLAFSFRQVGPVAAEMGLSLEETAAALDVLYNRGLRGEQAGTALRNIMVRLVKPTRDTEIAFSNLGIGLENVDGSARKLQSILTDLRRANVSDTYLAKIFGREALAASKTLIAATTGEYEKMLETITDTNTVAKMATAQMNTMDGSLKLMKNSLTELGIILGESIGPYVKTVGSWIQDLAIYLRTTDGSFVALIKNLGTFVAMLGSAKFGIAKILSGMSSLSTVADKVSASLKAIAQVGIMGSYGLGKGSIASLGKLGNLPDIITMNQIGNAAGSNWYSAINEYYRRISDGQKLTIQAAAQIKGLTAAQIANAAAAAKGAKAWKAFNAALVGFGKAALVMAAFFAAFKAYELLVESRAKKAERIKEAFPELEYVKQLNKEIKLLRVETLQDAFNKLNKLNEAMRSAETATLRGFGDYAYLAQAVKYNKGSLKEGIKSLLLDKGTSITRQDVFTMLNERGLPTEISEGVLLTIQEADKKMSHTGVAAIDLRILTKSVIEALEKELDTMKEGFENVREQRRKATQAYFDSINIDFIQAARNVKASNLLKVGATEQDYKNLQRALIYYVTGDVLKKDEDIDTYFDNNADKIKAKVQEMQNKIKDLDKGFLDFLRGNSTKKELEKIDRSKNILANILGSTSNFVIPAEIQGDVTMNPIDSTDAETAVANLRKTVADMTADYRLNWEVLSEMEVSQLKLNKLQAQGDLNRATALKAQKDTVIKLYDTVKANEFSWDTLKDRVLDVNKVTGNLVDYERLNLLVNTKLTGEKKEQAKALLETLNLQAQLLKLQEDQLEKEKERLALNGRGEFKNLEEYDNYLKQVKEAIRNSATKDFSRENVGKGVDSGVISLLENIDSVYDMAEKGMEGFADYMSDSMSDIVENWGKGWDSMKDALKSTLVDMLKSLSQYFIKQAMYMGISSLFGGVGGVVGRQSISPETVNGAATLVAHAKGSAWSNGLQTFATGGVVNTPTFFNTRSGKGLMGEAGPEAIMPLKRDSQGRLGVSASTGSTVNYAPSFNINMTTGEIDSQTSQRNANRMTKELDNQVKSAVLLVLAKEKRPGGLLYGGNR